MSNHPLTAPVLERLTSSQILLLFALYASEEIGRRETSEKVRFAATLLPDSNQSPDQVWNTVMKNTRFLDEIELVLSNPDTGPHSSFQNLFINLQQSLNRIVRLF